MNSYIVDCLEPQPGSFTSTLRADARPHEHASSGWGGAPLSIAALRYVPVPVAIRGVAVLAESCIVIEAGAVDLGEGQRRPERLGDPAGLAGVDGVAVAVAGSDAFEQQVPLSRLALPLDAVLHGTGPLLPLAGQASGGDELDAR